MPYSGNEEEFWRARHERYKGSILAVGRVNADEDVNRKEYAHARRQFARLVQTDFPGNRGPLSVVDFGYGHGHYAQACAQLGFGTYLGYDFAAPPPRLSLGRRYEFRRGDLTQLAAPPKPFDLVLCIDTIFHVVSEDKFRKAVDTLCKHVRPKGFVYVTGLFRDQKLASHVRHRPIEAFAPLELVGRPQPWRDNLIARLRVP